MKEKNNQDKNREIEDAIIEGMGVPYPADKAEALGAFVEDAVTFEDIVNKVPSEGFHDEDLPAANSSLSSKENKESDLSKKIASGELEDRGGILFDNSDDLLDLEDVGFLTVGKE